MLKREANFLMLNLCYNSFGKFTLSEEGKWHRSMVDKFNSNIVEAILGPQDVPRGSIDLHSLCESEAIVVVKDFVLDNPARRVDAIAGEGLHSEPGKGPVL